MRKDRRAWACPDCAGPVPRRVHWNAGTLALCEPCQCACRLFNAAFPATSAAATRSAPAAAGIRSTAPAHPGRNQHRMCAAQVLSHIQSPQYRCPLIPDFPLLRPKLDIILHFHESKSAGALGLPAGIHRRSPEAGPVCVRLRVLHRGQRVPAVSPGADAQPARTDEVSCPDRPNIRVLSKTAGREYA